MMRVGRSTRLREWRNPDTEVRIVVQSWDEIADLSGQFIQRPRSMRYVWHYVLRFGLVAVFRKVRSRLAETARNRKGAALGTGCVEEAPVDSGFSAGERVIFLASNHSPAAGQVVVDTRFVVPVEEVATESRSAAAGDLGPAGLDRYVGWTPYSGSPVDTACVHRGLQVTTTRILEGKSSGSLLPATTGGAAAVDRVELPAKGNGRPTAVLFGLGNYAKTHIVPYARRFLNLRCVHEIDPDQLRAASKWQVTLDTMPSVRENERYDAWFVAGYHHTHAALAVQALREGSSAVVEKPLATTWADYQELCGSVTAAMHRRLFACFHKRYSKFNDWARADLGVSPGDPVDMHCIVYEIPLPPLHWYNWPNSGSRLVSNGCHWLDYFLFVNNYCPVVESRLWRGRGSDVAVFVSLENSATMVMSLTDSGSQRLGVRDVIELRTRDATVRMTDGRFYVAENSQRVLRRRRVNPYDSYRRMYGTICRKVICGGPGDSLESLRSSRLMLELEDQLKRQGLNSPSA